MTIYDKINKLDNDYDNKKTMLLFPLLTSIKQNIKMKGLSYKEVAALVGISYQTINKNLNGVYGNIETIKKIDDTVNSYKGA